MTDTVIEFDRINSLAELVLEFNEKGIPENKRWKYVSVYQDYKARLKGIPFSGQFELTPFCNLDCKMCYVHLYKDQLNGASLLSVDEWKTIFKQAHDMGMLKACLTGGECLLYPGFEELYLYLEDLGIRPSIKTNGVLLDGDKFKFLKQHPPIGIVISLYGSSEDAYEKVTGKRVFNKLIHNLKRLDEINSPVSITITPSEFMYDDAENLLKLAESLDYEYYLNSGLFTPRENTGRTNHDLSVDQYVELNSLYRSIKNYETVPLDEIALPNPQGSVSPRFGIQCGAGRSGFTVQWNGKMCACTNLPEISADLKKYSFSQAWNIINKKAESFPLPEECPNCPYYDSCIHCLGFHSLAANPGHCNPYICQKTKAYVKAGLSKKPWE